MGRGARVLRGAAVTIPLRGHYGGSGALQFLIVRQPAYGKLSALQALAENRAQIVYRHDGGLAEGSDRFAYIVQGGGRSSAPAEVRLEIVEPEARLQVPAEIKFGEVVAGGSALRILPIQNTGGGVLSGNLTVSSPWTIAPNEFEVVAGATQTVSLRFQPDAAKDFIGQVTLEERTGKSTTVALTGIGREALRIVLNPIFLGGPLRRVSVSLSNLADAPLQLKFQTSPNLQPIEQITLAPKEEKKVNIAASC